MPSPFLRFFLTLNQLFSELSCFDPEEFSIQFKTSSVGKTRALCLYCMT